jgi:hypothetical protein
VGEDPRERSLEAAVKYLIMIYSNPASREIWEGLSNAQRAEGLGCTPPWARTSPPPGS